MDITVYSAPNCSACFATKAWLNSKGIPFHEVDISADEALAEQFRERGLTELPIVTTHDDLWTGFRMCKLHKLIGHQ